MSATVAELAVPHAPAPRMDSANALLIVISSQRGLCGGFNNQLVRATEDWLAAHQGRFRTIRASFIGRKAWRPLRDRVETRRIEPTARTPDLNDAARIGIELCTLYQARKYGHVFLVYNRYAGGIRFEPVIAPLIHDERPRGDSCPPASARTVAIEADPAQVRRFLSTRTVIFRLYQAMMESAAAEHAARMAAMDSSSRNIDEMIRRYVLCRNAARQGRITQDLNEIVSSAGSLEDAG
jgi:F-type H+-transporting ATPase subunit gamma